MSAFHKVPMSHVGNFFLEELCQGIRPCEIEKKSYRYNNSSMNATDEVKFLQPMTDTWNVHMGNWILIFVKLMRLHISVAKMRCTVFMNHLLIFIEPLLTLYCLRHSLHSQF